MIRAFESGHHLLGYVLLASMATIAYTIMLGSLQASASFYGATTFGSNFAGVVLVSFFNSVVLGVSVGVGCRYGCGSFLPRSPNTMASLIPYVTRSHLLIQDPTKVQDEASVKARIRKLESNMDRRYGFGWIRDPNSTTMWFGIDRENEAGHLTKADRHFSSPP